jgi:hypothetical protein
MVVDAGRSIVSFSRRSLYPIIYYYYLYSLGIHLSIVQGVVGVEGISDVIALRRKISNRYEKEKRKDSTKKIVP